MPREKAAHDLDLKRDFVRPRGQQSQWRREQEPRCTDWEDPCVFRDWQPTLVGTQSTHLKLLGSQPDI